MIKDFLAKKETILIFVIAIISIFFVALGFLFLFFKSDYELEPRIIPSTVESIVWESFSSKIIKQKIAYPEYMYIADIKNESQKVITLAEFEPYKELDFFSNQNHLAIYPEGADQQFFYGKTKESEFVSQTGQTYTQTEYLTVDNVTWAISLKPKQAPVSWQPQGFIWIQTQIQGKEMFCMGNTGLIASDVECDPFTGQKFLYDGVITGNFLKFGYEIINKNKFE